MDTSPITLSGTTVELVPLEKGHIPALWQLVKEDAHDVFRCYTHPMVTETDFITWAEKALAERDQGVSLPFVTMHRPTGSIAGSTRFMTMEPANRSTEIGNTWVLPRFQRTGVNTEAKYLMMRHAFEHWDCVRVALKTDSLNQESRAAILRIGAREEGTLRAHMVCRGGRLRDSVYFSVLAAEWPAVKRKLESMMQRKA